jgi:hypothetical protein
MVLKYSTSKTLRLTPTSRRRIGTFTVPTRLPTALVRVDKDWYGSTVPLNNYRHRTENDKRYESSTEDIYMVWIPVEVGSLRQIKVHLQSKIQDSPTSHCSINLRGLIVVDSISSTSFKPSCYLSTVDCRRQRAWKKPLPKSRIRRQ